MVHDVVAEGIHRAGMGQEHMVLGGEHTENMGCDEWEKLEGGCESLILTPSGQSTRPRGEISRENQHCIKSPTYNAMHGTNQ